MEFVLLLKFSFIVVIVNRVDMVKLHLLEYLLIQEVVMKQKKRMVLLIMWNT